MRKGEYKNDRNIMIKCACGCGELINKFDERGREKKYAPEHFRREIKEFFNKGQGEEIIKLYEETKSCKKVAEKIGVNVKTVYKFFKKNNFKFVIGIGSIGKKNEFLRNLNLTDNPAKRPEVKEKLKKSSGRTLIEKVGEERAKIIRENQSKKLKGKSHSTKGKTYEEIYGEEQGKRLRKLRKENFDKNRPKTFTEERKIKCKEKFLKKWKDPEYRERTLSKMLKNRYKKPTSFEIKISNLCIKNNLPFIYCGNGDFFIRNKNPDFIHKTKPIALEVFSNFFKISKFGSVKNYINERTAYFHEHGYEVIFIGEEEVLSKDWENICLNKIIEGIKNAKT